MMGSYRVPKLWQSTKLEMALKDRRALINHLAIKGRVELAFDAQNASYSYIATY